MKPISFFATPKTALSANEMKQLKGGGNCGYLPPGRGPFGNAVPRCGITEEEAQFLAQDTNGQWCCNDCSSRSDALKFC